MKMMFLGVASALLLSSGVYGQNPVALEGVEATAKVETNFISKFNRASTLLGTPVKTSEGKPIGKVQDLVFDLDKGKLGYAVLAAEGGGQGRSVAVPLTALKAGSDQSHLVLNMSEPVFAASEGLTEGEWPAVDTFAVGGPAAVETGSESSEPRRADPGETIQRDADEGSKAQTKRSAPDRSDKGVKPE